MRTLTRTLFAIAFGLLLFSCAASASRRQSRMILVVAGGMSVRDIAEPGLRHFAALFRGGSASLVNVRAGKPGKLTEPLLTEGMESECLTLGAGAMASGGMEVRQAGNVREAMNSSTAGDLFACRTGRRPGAAEVVHTEIARISKVNILAAYHARPGALGSALRGVGIAAGVVGNSDIPGEPHREAVAIAMDEYGIVVRGDVGSKDLSVPDPRCPYGIRANPEALLREIDRVLPQCRFVVVDFGDTLRADSYAQDCDDAQGARVRRDAARRLGAFVAEVGNRLDFSRDCMIVLSPSSRVFSEVEDERLTPVVIRGPGFRGGLLSSPSTRRPGLITLGDITSSILAFFRVQPPAGLAGRPVSSIANTQSAKLLLDLSLSASLQSQRQAAMRGASVAQSVVVVLVTAVLLLCGTGRLRRIAAWAALVPAAIPLVMLYMPLIYSGGLVGAVVWLVALTLATVGLCAVAFRSPLAALGWLCVVTVLGLVVDLVLGAPLTSSTIASYSLVEGARYYGIGNELMGTLLGAAIIGLGIWLDRCFGKGVSQDSADHRLGRFGKGVSRNNLAATAFAAALLAVVFAAIGFPRFGANAGGAAATAPAIAFVVLAVRGWRLSWRGAAAMLVFAVVVMGGLFALDAATGGGSQSHMGRVAGQAMDGGGLGILEIAKRKAALNFMLLSTSVWSRLLGLGLAASAVIYWWLRWKLGDGCLSRYQSATALGCCIGTAGAFAFNDSGVLAAATCCVFLWMLLVSVGFSSDFDSPKA